MRKTISVGVILALLLTLAGPSWAAAGDERPGQRGKIIGDLHSGRVFFEASNGFRIQAKLHPGGMTVTFTDDLDLESVTFEVEPPRPSLRRWELRVGIGAATWIQRGGVDGEPGEVEVIHPDGRRARHAVPPVGLDFPMTEHAPQDLEAYLLLRDVALDQASWPFWSGVEQLARELESDAQPARCEFACITCVGAILSYLASVGVVVVSCGPATPLCLLTVASHLGASAQVIAACASCLICLDQSEEEDRDLGAGGMTPDAQL